MIKIAKRYWGILRRPSIHLSLGFVVISAFVAGILFWGGFNTAMEAGIAHMLPDMHGVK